MRMCTLLLILWMTVVFAGQDPDVKDRPEKPLWMLFIRHPGKSESGARQEEGRRKKGKDAPVSGRTNDKVKMTFPTGGKTKVKDAEALRLEYNGAFQLEKIMNHAGNKLFSIFQSIGNPEHSQFWQENNPKRQTAKAMFQKLKDLFTNTATNIRFEMSDLRRGQLEEIAFKKSLEDAVASGTFSALFGGVNGQNQILAKLRAADIHILHDMAEKAIPFKGLVTTDRSATLLQKEWFKNDAPQGAPHQLADVADYVNYLLTWGLPPVDESTYAQNVQTALGPYIKGHAPYRNKGLWQGSASCCSKISWPDSDFQGHWRNLGTASVTKYYRNQLSVDWNEDVDFIIATGHGGWFKRKLIPRYGPAVVSTMERALDYTEFVLLKWEKTPTGPHPLGITEGWAAPKADENDKSAFHLYNLEEFLPQTSPLAKYEAFDDYDDYDGFEQYRDYSAYDDYDEYDDDFEYYYGEYYGEDDDNDLYEESLYEAALENLIKAQKQFAVAQRLLAPQRRMKAPAHPYH